MKSHKLLVGALSAATAAVFMFTFTSCQKNVPESKLLLDQETLEVGEEGGTAKLTYTLLNAGENPEISVEGLPEWITDPVTSVSGEVTLTVASNSGDAREAVLTLVCGTLSGEFTVRQSAFRTYPTAEEIAGKVFNATWCQFFADETYMFKYDNSQNWVMTDDNGEFVYLTAGEWAQDLVDRYNADHPDAPETVEAALGFDFTDTSAGAENYLYIKTSMDNVAECWSGSRTPYGDVAGKDFGGEYTYDEATGKMTIVSTANTTYTCDVTIQFTRLTDGNLEFQVLSYDNYTWTSDGSAIGGHPYQPWQNVFGGDAFSFMLADYDDSSISWCPCGKLVYTCYVRENV